MGDTPTHSHTRNGGRAELSQALKHGIQIRTYQQVHYLKINPLFFASSKDQIIVYATDFQNTVFLFSDKGGQ